MSSGITFYDYREAREYQEMLLKEGLNSTLVSQHGKYTVVSKERFNVKVERIAKKEMPEGTTAFHYGFLEEGKERHEIYLQPKSSSRTKVHELGHVASGHVGKYGETTGDIIEKELDAEIYAQRKRGEKPNYRAGVFALRALTVDRGLGMRQLRSMINEVSRRMEARGITVTRENKRDLVDLMCEREYASPEFKAEVEKVRESF